jgi:GNAT superfamily N-acetyltransferase
MKKLVKLFEFLFTYYNIYILKFEDIDVKQLSLPEGFKFKELNKNDLYLFEALNLKIEYLLICHEKLMNKDIVAYAIIDTKRDRLAAYSFINASKKYYLHALNKKINLEKTNCIFFEDDNTIEDYRRMGLSSYIMNERIRFAKENHKNSLGFAHPTNTPSIKTLLKFHFKKTHNFPIAIRKEAFIYLYKKYLWK